MKYPILRVLQSENSLCKIVSPAERALHRSAEHISDPNMQQRALVFMDEINSATSDRASSC